MVRKPSNAGSGAAAAARPRRRSRAQAVERAGHAAVARDERPQLRQQIGPFRAERLRVELLAVQHVVLDPPREAGLGAVAHDAALSSSVRAAIARASSMRHASSLRPIRAATSLKLSSSNLRSTMTSR